MKAGPCLQLGPRCSPWCFLGLSIQHFWEWLALLKALLTLPITALRVIVDDVIYFAEPMFQDGIIAQAVDQVVEENGTFLIFPRQGINLEKVMRHDFLDGEFAVFCQNRRCTRTRQVSRPIISILEVSPDILPDKLAISRRWDDFYYPCNGIPPPLLPVVPVRLNDVDIYSNGRSSNHSPSLQY